MEWERYEIMEDSDSLTYDFYSNGPKGRIKKRIKFQPERNLGRNVYNLMFGDYHEITNFIDDSAVSNNGDRKAVLRTVAQAVDVFVNLNPRAIIHIKGSSPARTRLYQIGIASAWREINERYDILGKNKNNWIPFKIGVNYEAFLVFNKIA
jgi:hypothetical protein